MSHTISSRKLTLHSTDRRPVTGRHGAMSCRAYGLRSRLWDSDGDKRMVWDSQGSSGYVDLLDERLP
jgi:hypothetical protein